MRRGLFALAIVAVDDGRNALNFSGWSRHSGEGGGDAAETTLDGSMLPPYYT